MRKRLAITVVFLSLVLLVAACGSTSDERDDGDADGAPAQTAAPPASSRPAALATPPPVARGSIDDICASLSSIGGLGGFGLPTLPADVSLEGAGSPTSALAKDLGGLFDSVLADAGGGDVSARCFYEVQVGEGQGVWVAFELSQRNLPSDFVERIESDLVSKGAEVGGVFSASAGDQNMIVIGKFPPGMDSALGGLVLIVGNMAFVVTGIGDSASSSAPEPESTTPVPTLPFAGPLIPPSAMADAIDEAIKPSVEEALGVTLDLEISIATGPSGSSMSYRIEGEPAVNIEDALTQVLEAMGARIVSTSSFGGALFIEFEDLKVQDLRGSGFLRFGDATLIMQFHLQ